MRVTKTAFVAVFAVLILAGAASAAELNAIGAADVRSLASDLQVPAPRPEISGSIDSQLPPAEEAPAPRNPAPRALEEVLTTRNGLDPVVITVPGLKFGEIGWGPFELSHILNFVKRFYPKRISEDDIVNGLVAFNPRYFFPEQEGVATPPAIARMPDNYLEQKLREIPGYAEHDVIIEPFQWSRDPGETRQTLPLLEQRIAQVCDKYKGTGRPIYILAHSWGSVLAHTALHRLAKDRPDLSVDKLITAGSPLVPANLVVRLFVKLEVSKEGLEKKVSKPANVVVWRNIWAMRDAYSNKIEAADSNYQADAKVENVEPTLIDLILHAKPLRKQARKDLFKIRDIKAWHGAYFYDYKAELDSIHKEIFVPVFRPVLAPQVVDCARPSNAALCPA